MPRVRPGFTSVTHGETTKRLGGRIDLEQFLNSAEVLENFRVLETGAFTRRAGTRFLGRTKYQTTDPAHVAHLVPFIPSNESPYLLEFGEGYLRIHRADGTTVETTPGVPLEIATPYLTADVPAFKYAPSNDVRYVFSALYAPRKLERYADAVWKLRGVSALVGGTYGSNPPPTWEYGTRPLAGGILSLSAPSGSGVTFTCAVAGVWGESDVASLDNLGRDILILRGPNTGARARIRTYVDATHVTADVSEPFVTTGPIAPTDWKITGSPQTILTPSAAGPEGTHITMTLPKDGWRLNDAVKFVRFNGGLVELNDFGGGAFDPRVVLGTIRVPFVPATSVAPSQAGAWSLEEPLWSSFNGYPAAGCFAAGRLVTGGVPVLPDRVDGSRVNDLENFATGTLDDDAFSFVLRSDRVNVVRWLIETAGKAIAVGTTGDGFALTGGGINDPITPSNVQANPATSYGASPTGAPVRLGNVILYLSDDGRRLIELVFDNIYNAYLDPDLLLLSSHLTTPVRVRSGVLPHRFVKLWVQRSPIRTVWALREDGILGTLTYLREQNVIGWARCLTDGFVEDGDCIPRGDGRGDRVWLSVRRPIDGGIVRCLEWFDDDGLIYDTLHTDSAVTINGLGRALLTPDSAWVLTADDVGTFTASPPVEVPADVFVPADVGRQIWELNGPGVASITVVDSPTLIHAQVLVPFTAAAPLAPETWGIARRDLSGLEHLEGQPVWVIGDGAPQDRYADRPVVTAGSVTARFFAVAFEIGRHYRSLFKSHKPPLSLGGSQSEAARKRTSAIVLRVLDSLNVLVNGKRELIREAPDPLDRVPRLRSTDVTMTQLGIDRGAQVTIEQDQPLPLTVLYIQPTIGVSGP